MKGLPGSILAIILVIWGCTTVVEQSVQDGGENRITILYSHYMSGYLEPCG